MVNVRFCSIPYIGKLIPSIRFRGKLLPLGVIVLAAAVACTTICFSVDQASAQVAPGWKDKVTKKDPATLQEEQRLEAYKKNLPELFKRTRKALEDGDTANYKKYKKLLEDTLGYMEGVFKKKYAPWYKPGYFDKNATQPDGTALSSGNPLGMAEAYRHAPKELEELRKFDKAVDRSLEKSKAEEELAKKGFIKPKGIDASDYETDKDKDPMLRTGELFDKAVKTCDPKDIANAVSEIDKALQESRLRERQLELQKLRPTSRGMEGIIIDQDISTEQRMQDLYKKRKEELQKLLDKCPLPKEDEDSSTLPQKNGLMFKPKWKFSRADAMEQMWSIAAKPIPLDGVMPNPVPQESCPKEGEFVMATPDPSAPESNGTVSPVKAAIRQMCDMIVSTYRQNLMASVDEGWKAPKPPRKGIYIAKFTYGIQKDGSLYMPSGGDPIHMVQSSGHPPIDQSARQRIYELFGPGAPTTEMGGYKRPLPSCYTEGVLEIDHTFKVIYR